MLSYGVVMSRRSQICSCLRDYLLLSCLGKKHWLGRSKRNSWCTEDNEGFATTGYGVEAKARESPIAEGNKLEEWLCELSRFREGG